MKSEGGICINTVIIAGIHMSIKTISFVKYFTDEVENILLEKIS